MYETKLVNTMTQYLSRFLLGLLLCSSSCQSTNPSLSLTNEDYNVYSAYLDSFPFNKNVSSADTIILTDSTAFNPNDINPKTPWSWVTSRLGDRCGYLNDTVACNKIKNPAWVPLFETIKQARYTKQELLLPAKFTVHHPIQLRSQHREHSFDQQRDDSLTYYFFSLSRIAFNADKTKALFFGSFVCGGTCGRGELVMLERVDQTWLVIDTFRFWIS